MQQRSEEQIREEERIRKKEKREKRKRQMRRRRIAFFSCLAVLILAAALFGGKALLSSGNRDGALSGTEAPEPEKKTDPVKITISCVGDIMVHKTQLTAQYNSATDTYNFDDNFQYVKKYIEAADLALCNVETTFGGGNYSGYPAFNSPESLADAIKNAGFDVAITSNNHMLDTGFQGMQRTIEVLRDAGLSVTGSKLSGEDRSFVIADVKGVKVAVIAYTYETPGVNGRRTINGNPLSDESKLCINSFSYNSLDNDLASLEADIKAARNAGAQFVITYFHWGTEYQRTPNDWQQLIAQRAANMGADAIFASHPHVLQGVEMLEAAQQEGADTVRKVPVFYSMGNFISNQRRETLDNPYTEQGMIANVHFTYHPDSGAITDVSMDAMPTWLDKYNSAGRTHYAIVPLDADLEQNQALAESGHLSRAQEAVSQINELLGL